jgi:hypothetical protein
MFEIFYYLFILYLFNKLIGLIIIGIWVKIYLFLLIKVNLFIFFFIFLVFSHIYYILLFSTKINITIYQLFS